MRAITKLRAELAFRMMVLANWIAPHSPNVDLDQYISHEDSERKRMIINGFLKNAGLPELTE